MADIYVIPNILLPVFKHSKASFNCVPCLHVSIIETKFSSSLVSKKWWNEPIPTWIRRIA